MQLLEHVLEYHIHITHARPTQHPQAQTQQAQTRLSSASPCRLSTKTSTNGTILGQFLQKHGTTLGQSLQAVHNTSTNTRRSSASSCRLSTAAAMKLSLPLCPVAMTDWPARDAIEKAFGLQRCVQRASHQFCRRRVAITFRRHATTQTHTRTPRAAACRVQRKHAVRRATWTRSSTTLSPFTSRAVVRLAAAA